MKEDRIAAAWWQGTASTVALQWVISPQISALKQWHICAFPAWIFHSIINASPRRGSCLQLVSKACADTALLPLLTKWHSDRGCTSNTECKEHCWDQTRWEGGKVPISLARPQYPPFRFILAQCPRLPTFYSIWCTHGGNGSDENNEVCVYPCGWCMQPNVLPPQTWITLDVLVTWHFDGQCPKKKKNLS